MTVFLRSALCIFVVLGTQAALTAQFRPNAPPVQPQHEQTIARALQDIEQGSLEEKIAALMLLGKFPHPASRAALRHALDDNEPRVRRAALVSILEQGDIQLPADEARRMLMMLGDGDAEIRRQISSQLQRIAISWQFSNLAQFNRQPFPAGFNEIVNRAFRDPDVMVRRNMIQNHGSLNQAQITIPLVIERMIDEDPQNRRLALRVGGPHATVLNLLHANQQRTLGEDVLWDREIARQLGAHTHQRSIEAVLLPMLEADDQATQTEAALTLMMLDPNAVRNSAGMRFLRERSIADESVQRVFGIFMLMPPERALSPLHDLLQARAGNVRLEALRYWAMLGLPLPETDTVLALLTDDHPDVRRTKQQWLHARSQFITADLLAAMARHPNRELREMVFRFAQTQDDESLRPVLLSLLLDETVPIRIQALQLIAQRRINGWERILQRSLRDPNPQIRQAAQSLQARTQQPTSGQR